MWVLIAAGLVIFGWIWLIADRSGQEKMMMTVPLLAVMGVLAVGALVAVQGPWRRVARGVAAVLVAIGLAMPALFRLKGLTGDFFPVLEYRFAPKHDTTLPGLPGEAAVAAPAPLPADPSQPRRRDDTKARRTARGLRPPEVSTRLRGGHGGQAQHHTKHSGTRLRRGYGGHPALRHPARQHF